ncbi:DNA cross-link repair 1A protein isoform X2 [Anabrus simplex]|uniref:DNA cross-link repair 1A protein isoform X2 n=1 Tax=Anabrus simplex TaxID=316456 RepID=UPI0035A3C1A8
MEDDELETFVPFMKKRTSKGTCSQSCISFSQRSSFSTKQLSLKCFLKPKFDERAISGSEHCTLPSTTNVASSTVHCLSSDYPDSRTKRSPKKRLTPRKRQAPGSRGFCPCCQVPFDSLNVLPGVHAAACSVSSKELEECPFGEECQALDVLHFRDFSHKKLAQLRASKEGSSKTPCKQRSTSDSSSSDLEPLLCTFRTPTNLSKLGKGGIREEEKNILNSSQKVVKCLNFKGDISYKDEDKNCKYKQNCIKSSTVSCEDCSNCRAVETPAETCVEMNLSPPASSCDPSSKTPVKVNLTYNESGWQSMDVNVQSDAHLEEVSLAVCDCSHCIEMKCTVTNPSKHRCPNPLEQKFFVNLEDLGVSNTNQTVPSLGSKQMTILSSLKPDGGSSTKLGIAVVSPPRKPDQETRTGECGMSISEEETISTDILDEEHELSRVKYIKNQSAKEKWKELMAGVKTKGYNSMSIMSSDSFSSSSERSGKKQCPFYKRIPDTTFVVDAFQYGIIPKVTHYFLSHFHADHYGGLRKSFNKPIICSAITARLVKKKLGVDTRYLNVIELDQPLTIRQVTITALDANHCPGSLMFLFQLLDGRNFLHVGDFRADASMESYPCFWNLTIDKLYLDTTYCEPKYTFPTQAEIIAQVVQVCRQHLERNPATLIVSGTYTIVAEATFTAVQREVQRGAGL